MAGEPAAWDGEALAGAATRKALAGAAQREARAPAAGREALRREQRDGHQQRQRSREQWGWRGGRRGGTRDQDDFPHLDGEQQLVDHLPKLGCALRDQLALADGVLLHSVLRQSPRPCTPASRNYIWLEAADNLTFTTDSDPSASNSSSANHLSSKLMTAANVTWRRVRRGHDPPERARSSAAGTTPWRSTFRSSSSRT